MLKATSIVDLHLLFRRGDTLLLQLRQNTGYGDGCYHLPAGHLEEGENVLEAACREASEELGIVTDPADLDLKFLLHQYSKGSRIGFFFEVTRWSGTLAIREPEKCAALEWFRQTGLPANMIPYARYALEEINSGRTHGIFGWRRGNS